MKITSIKENSNGIAVLDQSPNSVAFDFVAMELAVPASLEETSATPQPTMVVELIDLFVTDAPAKLESMRTAIARSDARILRRTAQSLRGISSYVGADRLADLCGEVEEIATHTIATGATTLICMAELEFQRVRGLLEAERSRRRQVAELV